jgi:hypothetical protein
MEERGFVVGVGSGREKDFGLGEDKEDRTRDHREKKGCLQAGNVLQCLSIYSSILLKCFFCFFLYLVLNFFSPLLSSLLNSVVSCSFLSSSLCSFLYLSQRRIECTYMHTYKKPV